MCFLWSKGKNKSNKGSRVAASGQAGVWEGRGTWSWRTCYKHELSFYTRYKIEVSSRRTTQSCTVFKRIIIVSPWRLDYRRSVWKLRDQVRRLLTKIKVKDRLVSRGSDKKCLDSGHILKTEMKGLWTDRMCNHLNHKSKSVIWAT